MKKIYLSFLLVLLSIVGAVAQDRVIAGKVTTSEDGSGLPGVNVSIVGTAKGVITSTDGSFKLNLPATAKKVKISFVGFVTQEIEIGSRTSLDVKLAPNANELTEVVVTAFGQQRQPRELGGAMANVKSKELTQANAVNLQNGLVGKVSGLQISTVNNGVFANTRIVLRGNRSLTGNNQALLVLDGVPVNLDLINSINPNDIADVTILKGANAAALYGSDAANGVMIVTTKKGAGKKPTVTFSSVNQFENISFFPALQTRFGAGSSVDKFGEGVYDPIENQGYGDEFDGSLREIGRPLEDGTIQKYTYEARPKEKTNFFNTGLTRQNDISFSAGDDRGSFYMSAQDVDIKGTVPDDKNHRNTVRFNANRKYGKFVGSFSSAYTQSNYDVASSSGDIYWRVMNSPMNIPLTNFKDINQPFGDFNSYYNDYFDNPYQKIADNRTKGRRDQFTGNAELNFRATSWLSFMYRAGFTLDNITTKSTSASRTYSDFAKHNGRYVSRDGQDSRASVSDQSIFGTRLVNDFMITAEKTYQDFNFRFTGGITSRESYSKNLFIAGGNLVVPTLFNVSNRTGEPGVSEGSGRSRLFAVLGDLQLGYKNWAFLEITGRQDTDSRLSQGNNTYFYPSVSGSVVLSDAIGALKDNSLLSYLKVKASWAKVGSVSLSPYSLESTFTQAGVYPYGSLPGFTANNTVLNPNLKPEFLDSKEWGLEASFWNGRATFELSNYVQDNSNQIINVGISSSTGYTGALVNAGEFQNSGWEFDLKFTPLLNGPGGLKWNASANLSINDSKVTKLYEGLDELSIGNSNYAIIGQPFPLLKLTDYKRDPAGRVIVDAVTGYPSQDATLKNKGRTSTKYILGLNSSLEYKGFTLSAVAEYRGGSYILNALGSDLDFTGISYRTGANGRQRFVYPNSVIANADGTYTPNTNITVANGGYGFFESTGNNRNIQTNYLTSAAFWKLREIVFSYSLPNSLLAKTKAFKSAKIAIMGRNLLMLRPTSNQWTDPEFNVDTSNAQGFTTTGQTPPTRLYGVNLTLTF